MCGYVRVGAFEGRAHDHRSSGGLVSTANVSSLTGIWVSWTKGPKGMLYAEAYDPEEHGELLDWLKEGDPLLHENGKAWRSRDGTKTAVHRHTGKSASGSHEYEYE